jgi:hypothetical protein
MAAAKADRRFGEQQICIRADEQQHALGGDGEGFVPIPGL